MILCIFVWLSPYLFFMDAIMFLIAALLVLMIIIGCATIICELFTVLFDSHFFCNTFKVILLKNWKMLKNKVIVELL